MQVHRSAACAIAVGVLVVLPGTALARPHKVNSVGSYTQRNLVSDQPGQAELTDANLVNPWGLAFGPATPAWAANNGKDNATLYRGATSPTDPVTMAPSPSSPLVVAIPGGAPTGQVFNGSAGFTVGGAPAHFIFSSEAGLITAWASGTSAQIVANAKGAIFKGLAIAQSPDGMRLYATDFHNNKVDVFNDRFGKVRRRGAFVDRKLPKRFAPFGIQAIGNRIVVTYAKQDKDAEDDSSGPGRGFVDIYTTRGKLVRRFARRGPLNSPWGIALAPQGFGAASGALLIGNFGDGRINAYRPGSGRLLGALAGNDGEPLTIDGLWSLKFGNGVIGTPQSLLFTAGPDGEQHGLFGLLTAAG
jgi:uncharacterized protein (TIGR03118 family)